MRLFISLIVVTLFSLNTSAAPVVPILVPAGPGSRVNCVINGGALLCWGNNEFGQLGDGTTINSVVPQIIIPAGVTQAISGESPGMSSAHSCAVVGSLLKCWGSNDNHELGDGTTTASWVPKTIPVGTGLTPASVTVGTAHTCVVFTDKSAKCWGDNSVGQLGYGVDGDIPHPTDVNADPLNWAAATTPVFKTGSTAIKTISQLRSGFNHNCALFGTSLKCWGDNSSSQTGDLNNATTNTPTAVSSGLDDDGNPVLMTGVVSIKSGGDVNCALVTTPAATGALKCWGRGDLGQLGDGGSSDSLFPVTAMPNDVTAFDVGAANACFIRYGGLKCWGQNSNGQLGNGTVDSSLFPTFVTGGRNGVTQLSVGFDSSCGVFGASNIIKCWGSNDYGQIGDGIDATDNPDFPNVLLPSAVAF